MPACQDYFLKLLFKIWHRFPIFQLRSKVVILVCSEMKYGPLTQQCRFLLQQEVSSVSRIILVPVIKFGNPLQILGAECVVDLKVLSSCSGI